MAFDSMWMQWFSRYIYTGILGKTHKPNLYLYVLYYLVIYVKYASNCFCIIWLLLQDQRPGQASVYHALIVIFLEFFAWGLLTSPIIDVSSSHIVSCSTQWNSEECGTDFCHWKLKLLGFSTCMIIRVSLLCIASIDFVHTDGPLMVIEGIHEYLNHSHLFSLLKYTNTCETAQGNL